MTKGEDLAFPQLHTEQGYDGNLIDANLKGGLSKREYISTKILSSILSNPNICIVDAVTGVPIAYKAEEMSLFYTDKLIKELNKKENENG